MTITALPHPARERSWASVRDRLLASPRFQRWALAFPPTRWIARRRARALFDLCAGFVYSQVLAACIELGLFDILAEGPQSVAALGARLDLSDDAVRRLLEAARSLELVSARRPGLYGLGSLGAALRGNPGLAAMVDHHRLLYADLADPVALLRGEARSRRLAPYWPYAEYGAAPIEAQAVAPYTALMSASQAMIAADVLDAYPVARHRHVLDLGGGDGAFLCAVAARAPGLHLTLFDLPAVADRASARFAREGLANRSTVCGGDFRQDALPAGADLISLVRVVHDHDDAVVAALLRAARQALAPGGTLLLAEPMADTPGAEPVGHAYFGFYLLAMGRGRSRSAAELQSMLRDAGFTRIARHPTRLPMVVSVLTASD